MTVKNLTTAFLAMAVLALIVPCARAVVTIDTVRIGNHGNTGELSGSSSVTGSRICGAVDYVYQIGKYEVTAGQYTEFLNDVGGVDTYGLYNTYMWSDSTGCKIQRTGGGTTGNPYAYNVAADRANRPVNYVSCGDAMRFANWLHNGQPQGAQNTSTTENGAYFVNGATTDADLLAVTRDSHWKWAVPTEDEWYKAAYYDPSKPSGAGYWDYPTRSDTAPSNVGSDAYADPGNHANYSIVDANHTYHFTIGGPYFRTMVGEFEKSTSAYGTFDQGGNVWEWNESLIYNYGRNILQRGIRGGAYSDPSLNMMSAERGYGNPTLESINVGFRVASVPEPSSIILLITAVLGFIVWRPRWYGE